MGLWWQPGISGVPSNSTTSCAAFGVCVFFSRARGLKIGHSAVDAAAAASFRISGRATGRHGSSKEF